MHTQAREKPFFINHPAQYRKTDEHRNRRGNQHFDDVFAFEMPNSCAKTPSNSSSSSDATKLS